MAQPPPPRHSHSHPPHPHRRPAAALSAAPPAASQLTAALTAQTAAAAQSSSALSAASASTSARPPATLRPAADNGPASSSSSSNASSLPILDSLSFASIAATSSSSASPSVIDRIASAFLSRPPAERSGEQQQQQQAAGHGRSASRGTRRGGQQAPSSRGSSRAADSGPTAVAQSAHDRSTSTRQQSAAAAADDAKQSAPAMPPSSSSSSSASNSSSLKVPQSQPRASPQQMLSMLPQQPLSAPTPERLGLEHAEAAKDKAAEEPRRQQASRGGRGGGRGRGRDRGGRGGRADRGGRAAHHDSSGAASGQTETKRQQAEVKVQDAMERHHEHLVACILDGVSDSEILSYIQQHAVDLLFLPADEAVRARLVKRLLGGAAGFAPRLNKRLAFTPFTRVPVPFATLFHAAIHAGRTSLLSALYSSNPAAVLAKDGLQRTQLMWAAGLKSDSSLVSCILTAMPEADLGARSSGGLTALHFACCSQSASLPLLLSSPHCSASVVNCTDSQGLTALHVAAKMGWTEGVQALIAAGADLTAIDGFGKQPVWYAYECFSDEQSRRQRQRQQPATVEDGKRSKGSGGRGGHVGASERAEERKDGDAVSASGGGRGGGEGRRGRGGRYGRGGRGGRGGEAAAAAPPAPSASNPANGSRDESSEARVGGSRRGGRGGAQWRTKSQAGYAAASTMEQPTAATAPATAASASSSAAAKPADDERASRLIGNICLLARDQVASITSLVEHLTHPVVQQALISSFTPAAIIAHLAANMPSPSYYTDNSKLMTLLARCFSTHPDAFFSSPPTTLASLLRLLSQEGDKRTQNAWAAALSTTPLSVSQRSDCCRLVAAEWRRSARVALFYHSAQVDCASEFCDQFFPVLLTLLLCSPRLQATEAASWQLQFNFVWRMLDAALREVGPEVETPERFAVVVHSFFQWCQMYPALTVDWEDEEDGKVKRKEGEEEEEEEGRRREEDEWDEARRQRTMIQFLEHDWAGRREQQQRQQRRKDKAGRGRMAAATERDIATVRGWREEAKEVSLHDGLGHNSKKGKRGGGRRTDELQQPTDDSKEEKKQAEDGGGQQEQQQQQQQAALRSVSSDDVSHFFSALPSSPSSSRNHRNSYRYQPAFAANASRLHRHPVLLVLLTRPLSPLFRSFVLFRHQQSLMYLMRDNDTVFHRYFYFMLAMRGSVGTDMRLRFVRSAVEGRWDTVGDEVVVAVSRLGVEGWDSEGESGVDDDDDDGGSMSEDDDDDDDDDDEAMWEPCGCGLMHDAGSGSRRRAHAAAAAAPSTTSASSSSSAPAAAAAAAGAASTSPATTASACSAPNAVPPSQPPVGQEQLDLVMAQILSASPHSLCTNLVARFVGERGVGDGPIRELLVMTASLLFSPACHGDKPASSSSASAHAAPAVFSLNPNGSSYHINPLLPVLPATQPSSIAPPSSRDPLKYCELAGRVLALCLLHSVPLGVSVSYSLLSLVCGCRVQLTDMRHFDEDVYRSLLHLIHFFSQQEERSRQQRAAAAATTAAEAVQLQPQSEDEASALFFTSDVTVGGETVELPLIPNGASVLVTPANLSLFLRLYVSHRIFPPHLAGYADAFAAGFNAIIPSPLLSLLSPSALQSLLQGRVEAVTAAQMRAVVQYHDGYSDAAPVICWFWQWVSGLSAEGRRRLWSFWSGHEVLGVGVLDRTADGGGEGGWHIERAEDEDAGSRRSRRRGGGGPVADRVLLPQSSTCTYTLRLPNYSSAADLQQAMNLAMEYGSKGFGEA